MRLLFLKLNQSRNTKRKILGVFSSKTKNNLFWGSKILVLKTQIFNFFSVFVYLCKRKHPTDFHTKNINI